MLEVRREGSGTCCYVLGRYGVAEFDNGQLGCLLAGLLGGGYLGLVFFDLEFDGNRLNWLMGRFDGVFRRLLASS